MLLAGKITGAYGIKGWVKVHALTDPIENFLAYRGWCLRRSGTYEAVEFVDGRAHGKGLIAQVRDINDRTAAEALRGTEVWVPASNLPALEEGDFYWFELQGMKVQTEHEGQSLLLGKVDHLLETGANDVLVVEACEGSVDERQRLIPYLVDEVVRQVSAQDMTIRVAWHPDD